MDKKMNESQMRAVVRRIIQESLKDLESDEMYVRYGNRNIYNDNGEAAMAAQGDDSMMSKIAQDDKGVGEYNPYGEEGDIPEVWKVWNPDGTITPDNGDSNEEEPEFRQAMEEGCVKLSESALRNAIRNTIKEQLTR